MKRRVILNRHSFNGDESLSSLRKDLSMYFFFEEFVSDFVPSKLAPTFFPVNPSTAALQQVVAEIHKFALVNNRRTFYLGIYD
jgi:hypothetical protein